MESETSRHSIESQTKQTDYVNVIENVRPSYEEHMSERNSSRKESFEAAGGSEVRDWIEEPSKINYIIRPHGVVPSGFTPSVHSILRHINKSLGTESETDTETEALKKDEELLREEVYKHFLN
ncbi:unnamed protein product [Spodoptera littoralis]|uniref:Uncharacterized protein n=1 Tax=Spodoptera littoralis TaxID=7109 RepID=A0A9P0I3J4_SPOLI|nr:unnamed protein product [Spodoptera littoralis]